MQHSEFVIGMEFICGESRWRCTDVGTRVIVAISLEPALITTVTPPSGTQPRLTRQSVSADPSWLNGPPYAVAEIVFDELDFPACQVA